MSIPCSSAILRTTGVERVRSRSSADAGPVASPTLGGSAGLDSGTDASLVVSAGRVATATPPSATSVAGASAPGVAPPSAAAASAAGLPFVAGAPPSESM